MTCPAHVCESKDVTQFIETCRPLSSLAYSKEQKALAEPTAVALAKAIRPAGPASFVVNDSLPAAKQRQRCEQGGAVPLRTCKANFWTATGCAALLLQQMQD
ncbi:unnamed protein product [Effrenium voratum]|nr:unnamed protein product [Effrenium voratum]